MRMGALVLGLLLAASCEVAEFPAATPETNAGEKLSTEDMAVYDAIVDGLAREGEVLGRCAPPPPDRRHPLSAEEIRAGSQWVYLEPFTAKYAPQPPYMNFPERVPASARAHLAERNQRRASTAAYRPHHFAPRRAKGEEPSTTLSLTLPGYSLSRTDAVVCVFCVSELPYFGTGQYVHLRKQNGTWRMVERAAMWIQ